MAGTLDKLDIGGRTESDWETWHILAVVAVLVVLVAVAYMVMSQSSGPEDDVGLDVNKPQEVQEQTETLNNGFRLETGQYTEEVYLTGVYRGQAFYGVDNETNPHMRITRNITAGNGIIEAYIVGHMTERDGNRVFAAEVFIDEEFRNEVKTVNLAWGNSFSDNFREYDFTTVQEGIYKDVVYDPDVSRFQEDGQNSGKEANVAVGNFSQTDVSEQRVDGLTFITAR